MSKESDLKLLLKRAAEIRRLYGQEKDPDKRVELRERYRCIDQEVAVIKRRSGSHASDTTPVVVIPGPSRNQVSTSESVNGTPKHTAYAAVLLVAIVVCGSIFSMRLSNPVSSKGFDAESASHVKSGAISEVDAQAPRMDGALSHSANTSPGVGKIELTTDNPSTLIDTNSKDYTIGGLRLGMSHDQAWRVLEASTIFIGERDWGNSERIYVYALNSKGTKGDNIMYLIWNVGEVDLKRIVFFPECRKLLSASFSRLLTLEAIDPTSAFRKEFIGYEDWVMQERVAISDSQVKYVYDDIGLAIMDQTLLEGREIKFSIDACGH